MPFQLIKLPYAMDALAPVLSQETLEYHYGKHHQAYINNLNKLIVDTEFEKSSLEQIILQSAGSLFNNAAQVFNHDFYWRSLTPKSSQEPKQDLAKALVEAFGSFAAFKEQFSQVAATTFGSGWTWLVKDADNRLTIKSTSNAGTPMTEGLKPLLTCDVWEHAYYIDYRNARPDYINAFWTLVNWDFVAEQYGS